MTGTYTQNGEYELSKLRITLPDGNELDLKEAFIEISIFETLLMSMSGTIHILDSEGAYSKYFLGHNEELEIEWKTAGSDNKIRYTGVIYKVDPPQRMSEHASGITLHFVSKEYYNNLKNNVESAYNQEISKTVETLFNDIKERKKLEAIKSKGIFNIIGTRQKPFDFISQLSRYAVSNNDEYAYFFYEDNQQFNFKPLHNLLKQEPEIEYYYKNSGVFEDIDKKEEEAFNAIQDYEFVELPNTIDFNDNGLLGTTSENLNLLEKSITTNTYKEDEEFKASNSLGKHPELSNFIFPDNYISLMEGTVSYIENELIEARFKNYMEMFKTEKFGAHIVVFGDTNNRAGMVLKCNLPIWNSDVNRDTTEIFSGDCLVFEVKHIINKKGYMQVLKLVKDSFEKGGAYENE